MQDTARIYNAVADYCKARAAARDAFMKRQNELQAARGSALHKREMRLAEAGREAAVTAAQAEARAVINAALQRMEQRAKQIKATPPTAEHLRLLQVLKLRSTPTQADFDTVANALDGNGLALAALDEMAKAAGLLGTYSGMATASLTINGALDCIQDVANACKGILDNLTGVDDVRLMTATAHARMYGGHVDADKLPQARGYRDADDFYGRILHVPLAVFSAAVDAVDD